MINYCSLEEAWGTDTSKGNQIYLEAFLLNAYEIYRKA